MFKEAVELYGVRGLARELGVTPAYVSMIASGKRPLPSALAERVGQLVNAQGVNRSVNSRPIGVPKPDTRCGANDWTRTSDLALMNLLSSSSTRWNGLTQVEASGSASPSHDYATATSRLSQSSTPATMMPDSSFVVGGVCSFQHDTRQFILSRSQTWKDASSHVAVLAALPYPRRGKRSSRVIPTPGTRGSARPYLAGGSRRAYPAQAVLPHAAPPPRWRPTIRPPAAPPPAPAGLTYPAPPGL